MAASYFGMRDEGSGFLRLQEESDLIAVRRFDR